LTKTRRFLLLRGAQKSENEKVAFMAAISAESKEKKKRQRDGESRKLGHNGILGLRNKTKTILGRRIGCTLELNLRVLELRVDARPDRTCSVAWCTTERRDLRGLCPYHF